MENFKPVALLEHRSPVRGVFFSDDLQYVYSMRLVSKKRRFFFLPGMRGPLKGNHQLDEPFMGGIPISLSLRRASKFLEALHHRPGASRSLFADLKRTRCTEVEEWRVGGLDSMKRTQRSTNAAMLRKD